MIIISNNKKYQIDHFFKKDKIFYTSISKILNIENDLILKRVKVGTLGVYFTSDKKLFYINADLQIYDQGKSEIEKNVIDLIYKIYPIGD